MHKRYILVILVIIVVSLLIWKISGTYALYNQGFSGNNIVDGNNWALNIVNVSEAELENEASLIKEVSTIGTTLSFEVSLPNPDSTLSFDFEVENMGKLDATLYALTLNGLSMLDSEYVNYEIVPLDYLTVKTSEEEGSILKPGEKHRFKITVSYQENVNENNLLNTTLNLGSTIIYEEKSED